MSRRLLLILVSLIVIIPLFTVGLAYVPAGYRVVQDKNGTQIDISVHRRWVLDFGHCTTMEWKIVGAKEVYLNNMGRVGTDHQQVCLTPSNQLQLFRVVYADGSDDTISIVIGTFLQDPILWALGLAEVLLGILLCYVLLVKSKLLARAQKVLNGVITVLFLILLTTLVSEMGLRLFFSALGTDLDKARYLYTAKELQSRSSLGAIPFLNYGQDGSEGNLGFRQTAPLEIPKPAGVYRIVTLGGSTTYGIGMEAINTYPAQLEKTLKDTYGLNVEVINAGVIGYNSWNSVVMLAFRALEMEPDLIIVYDSVNDVGARLVSPECYRGDNYFRGIQANAGVLQLESINLPESALLRFVGINLGWIPDPVKLESNIRYVIPCALEKPTETYDALIDQNPPVYFERNLISLVGIANVHNAKVMFSTWTYNSACIDSVCPSWWKKAIRQQNDVIRQVATDYDSYLFDLDTTDLANQPENWFGDYTHQSEIGTEAQAKLYAAYIAKQILSK